MAVGAPSIQPLPFSHTFNPGTTAAAPESVPVTVGDIYCHKIEVFVPPGPAGALGFALNYAGTQILPFSQAAAWLIVDDYENTFEVEAELGGSLTLTGYNVGYWPHTVYLRLFGTPISAYQSAAPIIAAPIDLSQLGG